MVRGVIYDREDTCPNCKRKRALDLYDKFGKPARFPLMLDRNDFRQLHFRQFYYMKCSECGQEYRIDWSNDNRIPVPLLGNKFRYFLEDYNDSYGV